jgi:hypothetical protein
MNFLKIIKMNHCDYYNRPVYKSEL